jgi:uncharacterized protein YutE (UPF0331/DUF86 family)
VEFDESALIAALRAAGAHFALVHGSRAGDDTPRPGGRRGNQPGARPESDLDVGAWWGTEPPAPWDVNLPEHVDLVILDAAPLWLAGRIALHGRLLFDDDPPARIAWQADTRLMYLDQLPLMRATQREWLEAIPADVPVVDSERVSRLLDRVRADVAFLRTFATRRADDLLGDQIALSAVKYRFVTAIEGCAKVAHHLLAAQGWSVPETNAAAVRELGERGVVKQPVADAVAGAVGFRNVLVHQYADVDDRFVLRQLGRLDDLEAFATQIAGWLLDASD